MSAIDKIRESDKSLKAALLKLKDLCAIEDGKAFVEASRRHSTFKARQFLQDALDSMPRCACGVVTDMACSDCRIEHARTVYVCEKTECRNAHESAACCSPNAEIDYENCKCDPRLSSHTVDAGGCHYKARRYCTK